MDAVDGMVPIVACGVGDVRVDTPGLLGQPQVVTYLAVVGYSHVQVCCMRTCRGVRLVGYSHVQAMYRCAA